LGRLSWRPCHCSCGRGERSARSKPPGAAVAVGTRVASRPPHRSVRAAFPHTACMGLSLSSQCTAFL
jgi:hypothetical protein